MKDTGTSIYRGLFFLLAVCPPLMAVSYTSVSVVAGLAALGVVILEAARGHLHIGYPRILVLLTGVSMLGVVSAAWALEPGTALLKAFKFALVLLPLVILIGLTGTVDEAARARLQTVSILSFTLAVVLLAVQVFVGFELKALVVETSRAFSPTRLNSAGAGTVVMLWPVLAILFTRIAGAPWSVAAAAVLLSMVGVVVVLGDGDAPRVAIVFAFATLLASRYLPRTTAWVIWLGIVTLSLALLIVPGRIYESERFDEIGLLDTPARHRIEVWDNVARYAWQRPLLGWGFSNSDALPDREQISRVTGQPRHVPLYPHNILLQMMVELGAVGIILLWLFFAEILRLASAMPARIRPFAFATFSAALSVALVGYPLWRSWWIAWIALAALGLAIAAPASRAIPADEGE